MSDLATLHHVYMYNNKLYNTYKKYNTLLDSGSTSASLNEYLYKNGEISSEKYDKFKKCGKSKNYLIIRAKDPKKQLRIIGQDRCGLNHCPRCRKNNGLRFQKRVEQAASRFQDRKLLTVAFANTASLGKKDLKVKAAQFSKMMRNLGIKRYVRVFEIKSIGNGYNIHIHAIIDHPYIPVQRISDEFRKVTKGESFIVDIRGVIEKNDENRSKSYSARYISKYLSKFPVMQSHMEYYEFFTKLKGTRFLYTTEKVTKNAMKKEEFKAAYDMIYDCDEEEVKNYYSQWCDNYFIAVGIVTGGST